jgi:hypothetical protein
MGARMVAQAKTLSARRVVDATAFFFVRSRRIVQRSWFAFICVFACALPAAAQVIVSVGPTSVNLAESGTQQFTATVTGSSNTAVNWTVLEGVQGGTVTSTGLYTAPGYPGAFHVVGTSQADGTKSATAVAAVPGFLRPDMRDARTGDTATTLQEGTILFAGGIDNSGVDGSGVFAIASAEIYSPTNGTFTWTGNMTTARNAHAATLLSNGQVLIAGGYNASDATMATAELYDPSAESFTATGSMGTAREGFTATTLQNGEVLVAGGIGSCSPTCVTLGSAEVYNPATGTFSATGSLITARAGQTATLLANGEVLIAGGTGNSSNSLASTELYNPTTGMFSAGPNMSTARMNFSATLLANGNVMLAGGLASNPPLASADIYDSETNTMSPTGNMNFIRYGQTGTLLGNGDVLIAGGAGNYPGEVSGLVPPAEIYEPTAGTFTAIASLNMPRFLQTASLLPNGTVLIAGGNGDLGVLDNSEIYDPVAGAFTTNDAVLHVGRAFNTQTALANGSILVAGGIDCEAPAYTSAELYNPTTGKFSLTGSMNVARESHTATLLNNGKVLVVGGFSGLATSGVVAGSAELYDPTAGTFSLTGSLITPRAQHAATLLPSGQVLITGGIGANGFISTAELYDPVAGTFSAAGTMIYASGWNTSTVLSTGQVVIVGGAVPSEELGPPTSLNTAEIFDPSTETFSAAGKEEFSPVEQTATLLQSGEVFVGNGPTSQIYNPSTNQFSAAQDPSLGMYARIAQIAALLLNGQVIEAGGTTISPLTPNPYDLTSDLYDPIANQIVAGDNMRMPRVSPTASTLANGNVMIVGGTDISSDECGSRSVDVYQSPVNATIPTITAVTPNPLTGFNQVTITIQGTGFLPGATASIDGLGLATSYISASELTAVVPATEMDSAGNQVITVADEGGQASAPYTILIQNPGVYFDPGQDTDIEFGSVLVGDQSSVESVTILSTGNTTVTLGPFSISGSDPGDYSFSNQSTCPLNGGSLPSGQSCTIAATFTPTATGYRYAQFSTMTDAQAGTLTGQLSGMGIDSAQASLTATTLMFANQGVGSTSATQSVTLKDSGNVPMTISSITLSSTADFSSTNDCPASLAAGANCAINVTFTPSVAGNRSATVNITDNSLGTTTQSVALTGVGTAVSLGGLDGGSTAASVPPGQTATFMLQAASSGGIAETVAVGVNCSSVPDASCSSNPNPVAVSGPTTGAFTVTVITTPYTAGSAPIADGERRGPRSLLRRFSWRVDALVLTMLIAVLFAARRRGAIGIRSGALAAALALMIVLTCFGCGGSGGGGGGTPAAQGTPPGNYSVVVTATSNGVSQNLTLALTIQ